MMIWPLGFTHCVFDDRAWFRQSWEPFAGSRLRDRHYDDSPQLFRKPFGANPSRGPLCLDLLATPVVRRVAGGQQSAALSGEHPDGRPLSDKPAYNRSVPHKRG
jgi:hypothetical protein